MPNQVNQRMGVNLCMANPFCTI